mmetsp:Transcript_16531/g.37231  ORF Transcript_16531/g.37231 Transcript_16531/m.37231 type:complete len:372 (+) Transcript_16531:81-1196(+)
MSGMDRKKQELKAKFRRFDKNGDNKLDFNEFCVLMQGLDTRTAHKLFDKVDSTGDGTVDFDEFVDYIYETEAAQTSRTSEGRRARLAAATAVDTSQEDDSLWDTCEDVFETYGGRDKKFEDRDFTKICSDCKLFDRKFKRPDSGLLFAKYKSRGKNTVTFEEFKNCVRGIAQKKGCSTALVQAAIAERQETGMNMAATQADSVRFHDDKSLYTGAHRANDNHGAPTSPSATLDGRRALLASSNRFDHDEESELPWGNVEKAFYDFCKGDSFLDGRELNQLCQDAKLLDKSCKTADVDIIFNKVKNRGERKIDFEQFKDACIGIARKKGCAVSDVQRAVVDSGGPGFRGVTQADAVRFHDDKSLYTGMHAGK